MVDISAERRYAEDAALALEAMGLTRAYGKVLGWLLICDPPAQTGSEIATALQLSKGSVSAGLRVLEGVRLVKRVAVPGRRGSFYEMDPHAFMTAAASPKLAVFRGLMEEGLRVIGGDDAPGGERLRITRDFYAFMEREIPLLLDRFQAEYEPQREGQSGG